MITVSAHEKKVRPATSPFIGMILVNKESGQMADIFDDTSDNSGNRYLAYNGSYVNRIYFTRENLSEWYRVPTVAGSASLLLTEATPHLYRCEDEAYEHTAGLELLDGDVFLMTDLREAERAELLRLEDDPVFVEKWAA